MPDIVLSTLNARYAHAAFGLRYLLANLGPLRPRAVIAEFDIAQKPVDVVEAILSRDPKIVGLGVYIWNAGPCTEVAAMLKRIRPDVILVLGGPEISHETEQQEIFRFADYVITGEADLAFAELAGQLLAGQRPAQKIIPAAPVDVAAIAMPYDLYDAQDVAHRVIYVEASRGCPFKCEFCLSSLDVPVRNFPLDAFLAQMQSLLDRGVLQFKFVDRTFNLNINIGRAILQFFLDRQRPGLFVHFEMVPDRLPEALRELIVKFPPGALQFEVGVQTFNERTAALISRRQDNAKVAENLAFLRNGTGVHVHADLIFGLPGEDIASFADGFDRLVNCGPQEIQVGILKRLRGTPIARHDRTHGMIYSPLPPYEILQNGLIGFSDMQRLRRFARYWDLICNSGNFTQTRPLIWGDGSPFRGFLRLSDWLFAKGPGSHGIALRHLAELLFDFLTQEARCDKRATASAIWADYQRGGRSDRLPFLRPWIDMDRAARERPTGGNAPAAATRQARHL